jgi:hypothetical protein
MSNNIRYKNELGASDSLQVQIVAHNTPRLRLCSRTITNALNTPSHIRLSLLPRVHITYVCFIYIVLMWQFTLEVTADKTKHPLLFPLARLNTELG